MRFILIAIAMLWATTAMAGPCTHLQPKPHMNYWERKAALEAEGYCLDALIARLSAEMWGSPAAAAPVGAPQSMRILPQPDGTAIMVPNDSLSIYNPSTGYYWSPSTMCIGGSCF